MSLTLARQVLNEKRERQSIRRDYEKRIVSLLAVLVITLSLTGCNESEEYTEINFMGISFQVSERFIVDEDFDVATVAIMLADGEPSASILVSWRPDMFGGDQEAFLSSFVAVSLGLDPEDAAHQIDARAEPLGGNRFRVLGYYKTVAGTRINHQSYFLFEHTGVADGVFEFTLLRLEGGDVDIRDDFIRLLRSVE